MMSYWVDKVVGDERAGVDLMTKQRKEAAERMKAYYAKRRKTPSEALVEARKKQAALEKSLASLSSWEGTSLYPQLEMADGVSVVVRENVRAIMGNSGWTLQQRTHLASKLMRTLGKFQKRGIFSKEKDKQYERFLDEI